MVQKIPTGGEEDTKLGLPRIAAVEKDAASLDYVVNSLMEAFGVSAKEVLAAIPDLTRFEDEGLSIAPFPTDYVSGEGEDLSDAVIVCSSTPPIFDVLVRGGNGSIRVETLEDFFESK